MRTFSVLCAGLVAMLAPGVLGGAISVRADPPAGENKTEKAACGCLTKPVVEELTQAYTRLIGAFDTADLKYVTENFTDWSQSINTFIRGVPPFEGETFDRDAFIYSQSNPQGPPTPITITSTPFHDCTHIAFVWESTFTVIPGGEGRPARGITILETAKEADVWKISRIDVEFNSLTWAYNLGGYYCFFGAIAQGNAASCPAPTTARRVFLGRS